MALGVMLGLQEKWFTASSGWEFFQSLDHLIRALHPESSLEDTKWHFEWFQYHFRRGFGSLSLEGLKDEEYEQVNDLSAWFDKQIQDIEDAFKTGNREDIRFGVEKAKQIAGE